jgi:hypothetical protein
MKAPIAQSGASPDNAQDCAIGSFIRTAQSALSSAFIVKNVFNSDLGWVSFNSPERVDGLDIPSRSRCSKYSCSLRLNELNSLLGDDFLKYLER